MGGECGAALGPLDSLTRAIAAAGKQKTRYGTGITAWA